MYCLWNHKYCWDSLSLLEALLRGEFYLFLGVACSYLLDGKVIILVMCISS